MFLTNEVTNQPKFELIYNGDQKPASIVSSGLSNQPQINNSSTFDKEKTGSSVLSTPKSIDLFSGLGYIVEKIGGYWKTTNPTPAKNVIVAPTQPANQVQPTINNNQSVSTLSLYDVSNILAGKEGNVTSPLSSDNSFQNTSFKLGDLPIFSYYKGDIKETSDTATITQYENKPSGTVTSPTFDIMPILFIILVIIFIVKLAKRG